MTTRHKRTATAILTDEEVLRRRDKDSFDGGFQACIDFGKEVNAELLEALRKAEAFIEDELNVRKQSFLPEGSPYIDEAQTVLDLVGAVIAKAEGV